MVDLNDEAGTYVKGVGKDMLQPDKDSDHNVRFSSPAVRFALENENITDSIRNEVLADILHELGHVFGFLHEHMSPYTQFKFDLDYIR